MLKIISLVITLMLLVCSQVGGIRHLKAISDDDFQRLNLGLNFELLELELFNRGLNEFSPGDFMAAGLPGAEFYKLLEFMRDQEVGHAALLTEILGPKAAKSCEYTFPYTNVTSYLDFAQVVTSVGEAGYVGFTQYLENRTNILKSEQIFTTESKQNAAFRVSRGLNPLSDAAGFFDSAITESQAYTLNAPYIGACPASNPPIKFTKHPMLNVTVNKAAKTVQADFAPAPSGPVYGAWVWGLYITFVDFIDAKTIPIPSNANGTAFVMIVDKKDAYDPTMTAVDDAHVIAGPQGVVLG